MLDIKGNEATFYQVNLATREQTVLQKETLRFIDEADEYEYYGLQFLYDNNQIWQYSAKANNLTIYYVGEIVDNFISVMVCGNATYIYKKAGD